MGEESAETETETETRRQFLYGDLDLRIFEARRLPNIGLIFGRVRQCFTACSCKPAASGGVRKIITTDPYVTVCVGGAKVASTRVVSSSHSPSWGERFTVPLAHPASAVELHVKDDDFFGSNLIGTVTLLLEPALGQSKTVSGWFPIVGRGGKPPKLGCALRLEMTFRACVDNPLYRNGAGAIRGAYFPARRGGAVKLYQDAHVPEGALPEIELEDGDVYKHGRCWEDICHAILEARVLVYIVGWSVYHQVRLVREPTRVLPRGGDLNLGDLLRYKSQEGVRVLLLVWDDKTSGRNFFIETKGVMQTHDEETRRFFKHSTVNCVLSPRYASSKLGIFKQKVVGTLYTHHQKCVIVDTKTPGDKRKITAFIGGLDLCDGRYDTPEHRLFSDLDTVFDDDYHNPTFSVSVPGEFVNSVDWIYLTCSWV